MEESRQFIVAEPFWFGTEHLKKGDVLVLVPDEYHWIYSLVMRGLIYEYLPNEF